MKMKMTMLAGALALAVAGQANAAIVDMATATGSDLVLNVWDSTTGASYTKDLGINISTFLNGVTGATPATLAASSAGLSNHTYAADANLASFFATSGLNLATTSWNVTAGMNAGGGFMTPYFLTTSTSTLATIKTANNGQVNNMGGLVQAYYQGVSGAMNGVGVVNGTASPDSLYTNAGTGSTLYAGTGVGSNWAGAENKFTAAAGVGSAMNFFFVTPSGTGANTKTAAAQFGNTAGVSTWTLASNGDLTFVAPPVPEPGEWLLMLSGLCLIGFIATRRKNEGSMTFA
jgi:hypothetical protein